MKFQKDLGEKCGEIVNKLEAKEESGKLLNEGIGVVDVGHGWRELADTGDWGLNVVGDLVDCGHCSRDGCLGRCPVVEGLFASRVEVLKKKRAAVWRGFI